MEKSIRRGQLFVAACAGMSLFGMSLAMPGTVLGFPEVRERLQMGVQQQGLITSFLLTGVWISTLVVGPVIDRFGNKVVLATSALLASIGFGAFLLAPSFNLLAVASVVIGLGGGGFNTATNAVVSALYEEKRAAMLNVLGIFFGGGAFLLPTIAAQFSPQAAIAFALGFAAVCAVGYMMLTFPPGGEAHSFSLRGALKVVTYPGVLLFAAVMFCESANEQTMNSFTSTWLGAAGATATRAAIIYSLYHLAMSLGRVAAVPLLLRFSKKAVVLASAAGAVCGTLLMAASAVSGRPSPAVMGAGVVITALSFAAIYPTMLGIAGDRYQRFSGTVFGMLFSIAMLGAIIAPMAVGVIGKRQSNVLSGTVVPVIGAVLVVVFTVLVTRKPSEVVQAETAAAEDRVVG